MNKPRFMIDNPNWMNTPDLGEVVYVHYAGEVHRTTNGIHLERFLREGGQLIPDPATDQMLDEARAIAQKAIEHDAPALKGVPDVKVVPHPKKEAKE